MILVIDIGNSNILSGIFENDKLINTFRIKSFLDKSMDEYYLLFKEFVNHKIDGAIISSVSPIITGLISSMIKKYYNVNPIIVDEKICSFLTLKVDDRKSVGADLLCDIVASSIYFKEGIIVDLGTANKIIYYKNNTLEGCIITPGVSTSSKALINKAALLSDFELEVPKNVLNNTTITCLQSGVLYGFSSMIDGLIKKVKKQIGKENIPLIATGGLTSLIIPLCEEPFDIVEKDLILQGIYAVYKMNN